MTTRYYRNKPLNLITDEIDFHAGEAMVKKHQQRSLLLQLDFLLILLQTQLHDSMKELREMAGWLLERYPGRNSLPELLIDHNDDGHDVSFCALDRVEIWPQVVFQILKIIND